MIDLKTLEQAQEQLPEIDWETWDYYKERLKQDLHFHFGSLDLSKPIDFDRRNYDMVKWVWENRLPPIKILNWGKLLKDRKSHKFGGFHGLQGYATIYHSWLKDYSTADEPEEKKVKGISGFGLKDTNDEHVDMGLHESVYSSYYHASKAHWIIDSIRKEGLWQPINGLVIKNGDHYSMDIHPGSVRSLIFEEMDDDSFELIVSDPHNMIDAPTVSLDEFCSYWKDRLVNRGHTQLNISFTWIAGVMESNNDFMDVSSFRPKVVEFNTKVRNLSKRKPLNIYIGVDKTHNNVEGITKKSIENSIFKSYSHGGGTEIFRFEPEIKYLDVDKIAEYTRPYANQSTWFTYSRFLIPYLENYEGFSMFLDDDIFFTRNPLTMFYFLNPDDAVACIQYPHYEHDDTKFDGEVNIDYPCKLWSSLMFFNNGHEDCKKLTPEAVNTWTGKQLHQFEWTDKLSKIPERFIFTEGYDNIEEKWDYSGIHYTRGGPWIDTMDTSHISKLDEYTAIKNAINMV